MVLFGTAHRSWRADVRTALQERDVLSGDPLSGGSCLVEAP